MEVKMESICGQTSGLSDAEFRTLMNKLLKDSKRSFSVVNQITNDFVKYRKKEIKEFNKSKMPANPIPQLISSSQNQSKKQKKKNKKGQQQGQGQMDHQGDHVMTDTDYLF